MNWGGFAAGLSMGINNGIKLADAYEQGRKRRALEDIRAQGISEATQARTAAVNGMINDTGSDKPAAAAPAMTQPVTEAKVEQKPLSETTPAATAETTTGSTPEQTATPAAEKPVTVSPQAPAAANGLPQPEGRFVVGNKRFSTREEAAAEADKRVQPITSFVTDNILKKQQQFYVENGDVEKAAQLGKYIESSQGQRAVKTFGKAITSLMSGDTENGVKYLGEYYNQNVDDGVDFTGNRITPDGKIAITLKKKDGGGTSEMVLSQRELLTLGMAHDPVKLQAQLLDAQAAKDKAASEIAKEDRAFKRDIFKDDRNHAQAKELKTIDQDNAIERMTVQQQLDNANIGMAEKRKLQVQTDILKQNGYTDDQVREMLPSMLKIGEHKKTTDPTERRALVVDALTKNTYGFATKSAEERNKMVNDMMETIYGGQPQKSPAASGLPQQSSKAPAAKKGIPVYDVKTGQIVYR